MGEYVYRMDDEEKMADHLERALYYADIAIRFVRYHRDNNGARMAATSAAHHARQYMMLRAVTGRD